MHDHNWDFVTCCLRSGHSSSALLSWLFSILTISKYSAVQDLDSPHTRHRMILIDTVTTPLLAIPVGDALWGSTSSFFFLFLFFFLFFFFRRDLVRAISREPSLVETPDSVCCLVLQCNFALLLTIQFASLFFILFFLFFSAKILSGPYLWNHYSQRLQIECAAWSCGLILHCCLPSNSLCYFFFFFRHDFATILSGPYLWNLYSQRLQIECAAWSCGLILHYCLPSNSLRYLFLFFFFCHNFVRAISLELLLAKTPNWVCCLVLRSNFALLLTIQFASLFFYLFFFPPRFCPA